VKIHTKESYIQSQILDYLKYRGVFCWRNNTGATTYQRKDGRKQFLRYGATGSPDIIGIFRGKFLGIEVKNKLGKVTNSQRLFLDRIKAEGGIALVARSTEDVERALFKTKTEH